MLLPYNVDIPTIVMTVYLSALSNCIYSFLCAIICQDLQLI